MVCAADAAKRSLNESFEVSPANATITRTGASSLDWSAVFASAIPCATFQRHDRMGNLCGSKSVVTPRKDAELCAIARTTTALSSTTSMYSVWFLNDASGTCFHSAGGGPPDLAVENFGISGACCAAALRLMNAQRTTNNDLFMASGLRHAARRDGAACM